jgi:hypothetical protein
MPELSSRRMTTLSMASMSFTVFRDAWVTASRELDLIKSSNRPGRPTRQAVFARE